MQEVPVCLAFLWYRYTLKIHSFDTTDVLTHSSFFSYNNVNLIA